MCKRKGHKLNTHNTGRVKKKVPSDNMWHYRTKSCNKIIPFFDILILMSMPIRGTKIALIDWDVHELWAPENEGLVMCQVNTNTAIHIFLLVNIWIWKIWIITRQLRVHVTLFFPYFSDQYLIKTMDAHIGQHISQATEMQTLCWSKTRPSFQALITHTFLDR